MGRSAVTISAGDQFGEWTVIRRSESRSGTTYWQCCCSCGKEREVRGCALVNGESGSCGHANRYRPIRHGQYGSPTYRSWNGMKERCRNPRSTSFKNYGGRGITVCERWLEFENFLADMGERPEGYSLERKDNDKGYCPENCKWATPLEQQNNQRRNIRLTYKGRTQTIGMWAHELGIPRTRIDGRLRSGCDAERALRV